MQILLTSDIDPAKQPLVMLTGGLRSPQLMKSALALGHADLLGVARFAVLQPELPNCLAADPTSQPETVFPLYEISSPLFLPWTPYVEYIATTVLVAFWSAIPVALRPEIPRVVGAGAETARYAVLMRALARGQEKTCYPGGDPMVMLRFWWYIAPGPWKIGFWAALLACSLVLVFWK